MLQAAKPLKLHLCVIESICDFRCSLISRLEQKKKRKKTLKEIRPFNLLQGIFSLVYML